MKTILDKFLAITLITTFALAFLGYFLIRGALHSFDNYVSYFMLALGIGLIVFFGIVLLIAFQYSKKKAIGQEAEKLSIRDYGTLFKIDLDTVRIKSNNWESSRFIENHLYDIEIKEKNLQTILEFEVELAGEKKQFHWPSDLEPKSLEMYFALQKQTNFYVDPNDHSRFYLDLNFIKN